MEQKKIKIGIFGLGRGGSFLKIIRMNGGEIVALCDKNPKTLQKAIDELGDSANPVGYSDFDSFIEHDMDAVFLANNFHEHTPYAVRCLEKNIHVLCECLSNGTLAEGVELVRAAEKSRAFFMLAENYPHMKFNREMKRICEGGTLGKILYAEGEYNHPVAPDDIKFLRRYRSYEKHWRNFLPATYYITHSLAPIMYNTGAKPIKVTAMPVFAPAPDGLFGGSYVGDNSAIITCLNDDDSVFKVTGCAHFGAHGNSYRICGQNGQVENLRGMDGQIMLRYNSWSIPEGKEKNNLYMPEWEPELKEMIESSGHGGGDFFVIHEFFKSIRENVKPDFDEYFATRLSSVAIMAHRSILEGGKPFEIPDFSKEEDRVKYENDRLCPFYMSDGTPPTMPCCSRPDFKPSHEQLERYLNAIKPDAE